MITAEEFESLAIEWRNAPDGFCEVDFKVWLMQQVIKLRKNQSGDRKIGAIDELLGELDEHYNDPLNMISTARAELAQLRAYAAEAQAAHVYLDESPVNSSDDPPLELADRMACIVNEVLQLRDADIRTMEHCEVCGGLLVLDVDAPEDAEPFCPFCEPQKVRADLQAAQERSAEQARQLDAAHLLITQAESDATMIINMSDGQESEMADHISSQLRAWLAANAQPQEQP